MLFKWNFELKAVHLKEFFLDSLLENFLSLGKMVSKKCYDNLISEKSGFSGPPNVQCGYVNSEFFFLCYPILKVSELMSSHFTVQTVARYNLSITKTQG